MSTPAMIQVGATPQWAAKDASGNDISSDSLKGTKYIIAFYPKSCTSGCTQEMQSLSENLSTFETINYKIYGCSADDATLQQKFIEKSNLTVPLISDIDHNVSKTFGVFGEKKMFGRSSIGITRATFIIDENGIVTHVIPKVETKNHAHQLFHIIDPIQFPESTTPTRKNSRKQIEEDIIVQEDDGLLNKSGRPRRAVSRSVSVAQDSITEDDLDDEEAEEQPKKVLPRRRSTQSLTPLTQQQDDGDDNTKTTPKKRGRPPKKVQEQQDDEQDDVLQGEVVTKRSTTRHTTDLQVDTNNNTTNNNDNNTMNMGQPQAQEQVQLDNVGIDQEYLQVNALPTDLQEQQQQSQQQQSQQIEQPQSQQMQIQQEQPIQQDMQQYQQPQQIQQVEQQQQQQQPIIQQEQQQPIIQQEQQPIQLQQEQQPIQLQQEQPIQQQMDLMPVQIQDVIHDQSSSISIPQQPPQQIDAIQHMQPFQYDQQQQQPQVQQTYEQQQQPMYAIPQQTYEQPPIHPVEQQGHISQEGQL